MSIVARETITKDWVTMRSAKTFVFNKIYCIIVAIRLNIMNSILNMVHVLDRWLDWRKLWWNRGSISWFKESRAKIILSKWETSFEEKWHKMSTATTKTVIIVIARLSITLILKAMNMAASLTPIKGNVVRVMRFLKTSLFKRILMFAEIHFVFLV